MSHGVQLPSQAELELLYPPSYAPMVEGSEQFKWLQLISGALEDLYQDRDDVLVAGDMMWYPVEGDSKTCVAPDVFVAFGRPNHERTSYVQFVEDDVPPQVVFEILSKGNRAAEIAHKLWFYDKYGTEEYYTYNPSIHEFRVWIRAEGSLREQRFAGAWRSPRLGVRFEWTPGEPMRLFYPDGEEIHPYSRVHRNLKSTTERLESTTEQLESTTERLESTTEQLESTTERLETVERQKDAAEAEIVRLKAEIEALRNRNPDR